MDQLKLRALAKKYGGVLLVLLAGIVLMVLPDAREESATEPAAQSMPEESMETRLTRILSRIDGAGEVAVMLTEAAGERIIYQTDGNGADTVLVTDASRSQQGLVRTREPPSYRGAIIVCTGADSAAVRLAVVEAVSNVTGLGADRITVVKME